MGIYKETDVSARNLLINLTRCYAVVTNHGSNFHFFIKSIKVFVQKCYFSFLIFFKLFILFNAATQHSDTDLM